MVTSFLYNDSITYIEGSHGKKNSDERRVDPDMNRNQRKIRGEKAQ